MGKNPVNMPCNGNPFLRLQRWIQRYNLYWSEIPDFIFGPVKLVSHHSKIYIYPLFEDRLSYVTRIWTDYLFCPFSILVRITSLVDLPDTPYFQRNSLRNPYIILCKQVAVEPRFYYTLEIKDGWPQCTCLKGRISKIPFIRGV